MVSKILAKRLAKIKAGGPLVNFRGKDHAAIGYSPSGMYRSMNCYKSILLEKNTPDTTSEAAERGSAIHAVIEKAGNALLRGVRNPLAGVDDAEAVEYALHFFAVRDHYIAKIGRENIVHEAFEGKVALTMHIWGSLDWVLIYNAKTGDSTELRAIIWDHKFGRIPVYAKDNTQAKVYALIMREEYKWQQATLVIYQPTSSDLPDNPVDPWVFTAEAAAEFKEEILAYEKDVEEVISLKLKALSRVGKWCMFCRGQVRCERYIAIMQEDAMLVLDEAPPMKLDIETDKRGKSKTVEVPDIKDVTDEQIVAILANRNKIASYIKAVERYETARQERGTGCKDLKLVSVKGRRTHIKGQEADTAVQLKRRLGIVDPWNRTLKGIGVLEVEGVEKLEGDPALKTKKARTEKVKMLIADLVTMSEPSSKLVSVDDPRPAINSTPAIDMVGDLNNEKGET